MILCLVVYFPLRLSNLLSNVGLYLISSSYEIKAGLSLVPLKKNKNLLKCGIRHFRVSLIVCSGICESE